MPTTRFQIKPLNVASFIALPRRGLPRRLARRLLPVEALEHPADLAAKAPRLPGEEGDPQCQQFPQGGGRLLAAHLSERAHRAQASADPIAAGGLFDQRHQVGEQFRHAHGTRRCDCGVGHAVACFVQKRAQGRSAGRLAGQHEAAGALEPHPRVVVAAQRLQERGVETGAAFGEKVQRVAPHVPAPVPEPQRRVPDRVLAKTDQQLQQHPAQVHALLDGQKIEERRHDRPAVERADHGRPGPVGPPVPAKRVHEACDEIGLPAELAHGSDHGLRGGRASRAPRIGSAARAAARTGRS